MLPARGWTRLERAEGGSWGSATNEKWAPEGSLWLSECEAWWREEGWD